MYTKNTDTGTGASDWTVPLEDDDEDAPFCTANSLDTFACSEIICIVQRALDTGDVDQDFMFTPTPNTQDKMYIRPGRAFVGINESDCSSNCAYAQKVVYGTWTGNDPNLGIVEISIYAGATSVFATSAAVVASVAALFAF